MNNKIMKLAINEAKKAYKKGEVPVGAVIAKNNKVVALAHNEVEKKKTCTLHAEIIAITKASKKVKNWRLNDCEMYVTLEPCGMCAAAIELSRISKIYFLIKKDKNIKINDKKYIYVEDNDFNKKILNLIQTFFKSKR